MFDTPASYIVKQSYDHLQSQLDDHASHAISDTMQSELLLPRSLKFVPAKDPRNGSPPHSMSTSMSSSASTPPSFKRQHSDFQRPTYHLYSENDTQALMHWKSKSMRGGSGLRNLGNSCFMNATLQCLCYTPVFQNLIASNFHRKNCSISGFCIFCELETLMPAMLRSSNETQVPKSIFRNLRTLSKTLRPGRQEDAHEFLRYLMDALQTSVLKQEPQQIKEFRVRESSAIHKIWGGYLRSQVKCTKCGNESNTYEAILDLSLEIKGSSVKTALKNFTDPEVLDGDNKYKCTNCKKLRRAVKQFTIFEPPNVLVLHLKRFEFANAGPSYSYSRSPLVSGNKINKFVHFEPTFDITEFMSYDTCDKVSYGLFGVLVHYGYSAHGGHYVSYIKAASGQWYLMDDSRCTSARDTKVFGEKAYMLFYVRNEAKKVYVSPENTPFTNKKPLRFKNTRTNDSKTTATEKCVFDGLQDLHESLNIDNNYNSSSTKITNAKQITKPTTSRTLKSLKSLKTLKSLKSRKSKINSAIPDLNIAENSRSGYSSTNKSKNSTYRSSFLKSGESDKYSNRSSNDNSNVNSNRNDNHNNSSSSIYSSSNSYRSRNSSEDELNRILLGIKRRSTDVNDISPLKRQRMDDNVLVTNDESDHKEKEEQYIEDALLYSSSTNSTSTSSVSSDSLSNSNIAKQLRILKRRQVLRAQSKRKLQALVGRRSSTIRLAAQSSLGSHSRVSSSSWRNNTQRRSSLPMQKTMNTASLSSLSAAAASAVDETMSSDSIFSEPMTNSSETSPSPNPIIHAHQFNQNRNTIAGNGMQRTRFNGSSNEHRSHIISNARAVNSHLKNLSNTNAIGVNANVGQWNNTHSAADNTRSDFVAKCADLNSSIVPEKDAWDVELDWSIGPATKPNSKQNDPFFNGKRSHYRHSFQSKQNSVNVSPRRLKSIKNRKKAQRNQTSYRRRNNRVNHVT